MHNYAHRLELRGGCCCVLFIIIFLSFLFFLYLYMTTEAAYKEFMRVKYEHECWENQIILLSRKMRAAAEQGQPAPA